MKLNALETHTHFRTFDEHQMAVCRDAHVFGPSDTLNQLGKSPSLLEMLKLNAKSKITDTRNCLTGHVDGVHTRDGSESFNFSSSERFCTNGLLLFEVAYTRVSWRTAGSSICRKRG